jgi:predicted DsbA family dithiol-disulfide isomerase
VEIVYFTDPLCCWSWALEPHWRRLLEALGQDVRWTYRMGGMIPSWNAYQVPMNDVSRPTKMGPVWIQTREAAEVSIDERIWVENPPASSYPACLAVKAAELQSPAAGDAYLRRLREAVMTERRNIARREVLRELAFEVAAREPQRLGAERLVADMAGEAAAGSIREDLKEVRYRDIAHFPTLTLKREGADRGILLVGYRPYDALLAALGSLP